MNIFLLDRRIKRCAHYHCDKHVVKMIVEYAQLLCTALRSSGVRYGYALTHPNHPCAQWTRESQANWKWLRSLALALCAEYTYRYGKVHKSEIIIRKAPVPTSLPRKRLNMARFPQCMPDIYRHDDPVTAYRNYYIHGKNKILSWKRRRQPQWIEEAQYQLE